MSDNQSGYTDEMFLLNQDLRIYAKFIAAMIRLGLMEVRVGQILSANYSQIRFEALRVSRLK